MDLEQTIKASLEESARPAFSDKDIEHLGILVRLTVEFHDFLHSSGRWPRFPEDPNNDCIYAIESIFSGMDSFTVVTQAYGIMMGSLTTTIDWKTLTIRAVKGQFVVVFEQFVAEKRFERKCRLLLDLFKLQIVFAGAYYDLHPNFPRTE